MNHLRHVELVAFMFLLVVLVATCGENNPVGPVGPVGPSAPRAVSLAVSGEASLTSINQTSQLTATATLSDGTKRDVTNESEWSSADPGVASVSSRGVLTAVSLGETYVEARYQETYASVDARVLPVGTYILSGKVTEAVDLPLDGVSVQVRSGSIVLATTTTQNNYYTVPGVSGTVTVTATLSGYIAQSKTVTMSTDQQVDFELRPTNSPAPMAGTYRLTFTASGACARGLPAGLSERIYTATLTQAGAAVDVTLSGAAFIQGSDHFSGRVTRNQVSFALSTDYDNYYNTTYSVAEILGTGYLTLAGHADGASSGGSISGTLAGSFQVFATLPIHGTPTHTCAADDHSFAFVK